MISHSIYKNSIILAIFAMISTALVAFTDLLTRDRIESEKERALEKILHQIIPADSYDNDLYRDCILQKDNELLGSKELTPIFRARKNNQPIALFIQTVAPDGYNGAIDLVVGVNEKNEIAGVRVLQHNETPGLGDQIEYRKSHWLDIFLGRSLDNLDEKHWKVKKDGGEFDALTGATITPRAVVKAVLKTLQYVHLNHDRLYTLKSNCQEKSDE